MDVYIANTIHSFPFFKETDAASNRNRKQFFRGTVDRWRELVFTEQIYTLSKYENKLSVKQGVESSDGSTSSPSSASQYSVAYALMLRVYLHTKRSLCYISRHAPKGFSYLTDTVCEPIIHGCCLKGVVDLSVCYALYVAVPKLKYHYLEDGSLICLRIKLSEDTHLQQNTGDTVPASMGILEGWLRRTHQSLENDWCVISVPKRNPWCLVNTVSGDTVSPRCTPVFYLNAVAFSIFSIVEATQEKSQSNTEWRVGSLLSIQCFSPITAATLHAFSHIIQILKVCNKEQDTELRSMWSAMELIDPVNIPWDYCFPAEYSSHDSLPENHVSHKIDVTDSYDLSLHKEAFPLPHRVIISGCPGSGKTFFLIRAVMAALKSQSRVVVVVYSTAQAKRFVELWKENASEIDVDVALFDTPQSLAHDCARHLDLEGVTDVLNNLKDCLGYKDVSYDQYDDSPTPLVDDTKACEGKRLIAKKVDMSLSSDANDNTNGKCILKCHVKTLVGHVRRLWNLMTKLEFNKNLMRRHFLEWQEVFCDVMWHMDNEDSVDETHPTYDVHPMLCILWVCLARVVNALLLRVRSTGDISSASSDNGSTENTTDSDDLPKLVSLSQWPRDISLQLRATQQLIHILHIYSGTGSERTMYEFLEAMCLASRRLVVIPVSHVSNRLTCVLASIIHYATHVFLDDCEHVPYLTLLLVLLIATAQHRYQSKKYQQRTHLALCTVHSSKMELTCNSKDPYDKQWSFRVFPMSCVLRPEQLRVMKGIPSQLGSSCTVVPTAYSPLPLNSDGSCVSFGNLGSVCLVTTSTLLSLFAFQFGNKDGCCILEAVIARVLMNKLNGRCLETKSVVHVFVISLRGNAMFPLISLLGANTDQMNIIVEFGTPENFIGRHCDVTLLLLLCCGTSSCGMRSGNYQWSHEENLGYHTGDIALDSLRLYDCEYCLVESRHRMRLALSRARHCTYIIGQTPQISMHHPYGPFTKNLHDHVSPSSLYACQIAPENLCKSISNFFMTNVHSVFPNLVNLVVIKPMKPSVYRPASMDLLESLNLLIASYGIHNRTLRCFQRIFLHKCRAASLVQELLTFTQKPLYSLTVSSPRNMVGGSLASQCRFIEKRLHSSLDWNVGIVFMFTEKNVDTVKMCFGEYDKSQHLRYFVLDASKHFHCKDLIAACVYPLLEHTTTRNAEASHGSEPWTVREHCRPVVVIVLPYHSLTSDNLNFVERFSLTASLMWPQKMILLTDAFHSEVNYDFFYHSREGSSCDPLIPMQLSILCSALHMKLPGNLMEVVQFTDDGCVDIQNILYLLQFMSASKSLPYFNWIRLIGQHYKGNYKFLSVAKKTCIQEPVMMDSNVMANDKLAYNSNAHDFVHNNGRASSSPSNALRGSKKKKGKYKRMEDMDKIKSQRYQQMCFPMSKGFVQTQLVSNIEERYMKNSQIKTFKTLNTGASQTRLMNLNRAPPLAHCNKTTKSAHGLSSAVMKHNKGSSVHPISPDKVDNTCNDRFEASGLGGTRLRGDLNSCTMSSTAKSNLSIVEFQKQEAVGDRKIIVQSLKNFERKSHPQPNPLQTKKGHTLKFLSAWRSKLLKGGDLEENVARDE